jgi:hypothetical protein
MKSPKNLVIAALAVFSAGISVVAWKYYWKAAQFEAVALGAEDAATLRQRLAEAEKRRRDLEARLVTRDTALGGTAEGAATDRPPGDQGPGRGRGGRGGPGGPRGAEFDAAMDRPEMQRLMALQQKAALDGRYGALFKALNLSPEKLAAFKNLLAEKEATVMDTMRAAREQGIDPRSDPEAFKKLMATTQAETNAAIKAAVGDAAFAEYQSFETTAPQRAVVSQLQQALSYTSEPLTSNQSEQLVQLLTANSAQNGGTTAIPADGGGRGGPFGGGPGGRGGNTVAITTETITQAQTVLSSTQLQALQELQTLQQAQRQAQQVMRTGGAGGATTPARGSGGE